MNSPLRRTLPALARRRVGPPTMPGKVASLSREQEALLQTLRPVRAPAPSPAAKSKADLRSDMIRYGKLKRMQHLDMERRRQQSLRAMWCAVDAMPHARRLEAIKPQVQVQVHVPNLTHTPPVEGFDLSSLATTRSAN